MTDQRFTELLGKQLAGELSSDESVELKSILAGHPVLKNEYDVLQAYFETETVEDENTDPVFERIKAQIKVPVQPVLTVRKNKSSGFWLKIAAVVAIAFAAVLVYNRESIFSTPAALLNAQTRAAEIKTIILADGSTVKMNSESSLKYPAQFNGDTRNVYLSGEAFFDVKKDPEHPFIVHTSQVAVKVLGTEFDVKAYANDAFTEATLIRGKVSVSVKNNDNQTFILKPRDKFTLSNGKGNISRFTIYNGIGTEKVIETAWLNHGLTFKNQRFDEVAKLFERWYGVKVNFKASELKDMRFTSYFEKESITEALNILKLIENFNYSIKGKNVYIYR